MKQIGVLLLGLFMFGESVMACPSDLRLFNKQLEGKETCVLEGTYTGTLELTSGFNYLLLGAVWIGREKRDPDLTLHPPIAGAQLIIHPGVTVFALNPAKDTTGLWDGFTFENGQAVIGDVKSFISVTRDSLIEVRGTKAAPVVMTSAQGAHLANPGNVKAPGQWGGLVISGKAKSNKCSNFADCTLPGEAGTGWYGGDDDFHSSGSLEFLQVEYGGDRIDGQKELNGVTFNTVGLGTLIENVAVLYNSDDCIEFFGGAATGRNIFCYKGLDDGVDTTDGARVFLQNGVVVAADYPEAGDDNDRHMLEADSSRDDAANARLRSHPVLANFTFVGGLNSQGFKLRRGTNYTLVNSVVHQVDMWCMDPTGSGDLLLYSNVFAGCDGQDPIQGFGDNDLGMSNLMLNGWVPQAGSPLMSGAEVIEEFIASDLDLDDVFYDVYIETDYRGAMGSEDWTTWVQLRD